MFPPPVAGYTNVVPSVLVEIAQCESQQRQFTSNGSVLVSPTSDKGYFQINQVHFKEALAMGYNLDTEEGNIRYALYLYGKYGTQPWFMSQHCWGSHDT